MLFKPKNVMCVAVTTIAAGVFISKTMFKVLKPKSESLTDGDTQENTNEALTVVFSGVSNTISEDRVDNETDKTSPSCNTSSVVKNECKDANNSKTKADVDVEKCGLPRRLIGNVCLAVNAGINAKPSFSVKVTFKNQEKVKYMDEVLAYQVFFASLFWRSFLFPFYFMEGFLGALF